MSISDHARATPDKPATIMAGSGEVVTYAQLEERSVRLARLLAGAGLEPGDVVAVFMENNRGTTRCTGPPCARACTCAR